MNEVRIAGISCDGTGGVDVSCRRALGLIDEACGQPLDIICLPELFAWMELETSDKAKVAEPIDGPFATAMSQAAARHKVHLLAPLVEQADDGHVYNTQVWFDRNGQVLGRYRKVFVTYYEMDGGFHPGQLDFDVFQTEFGPIGCCICFDLNFPELQRRLGEQRPRLTFFPTMFQGTTLLQTWALQNQMYYLSVACVRYGMLVDPRGKIVIEPWNHHPTMISKINLDYAVLFSDINRDKWSSVKSRYGDKVRWDDHYMDGTILFESRHPELSALDMVRACDLELRQELFERTRDQRQQWLESR